MVPGGQLQRRLDAAERADVGGQLLCWSALNTVLHVIFCLPQPAAWLREYLPSAAGNVIVRYKKGTELELSLHFRAFCLL